MKVLTFLLILATALPGLSQQTDDTSDSINEEIPAAKSSLIQSAKDEDYTKGLFFDQPEQGALLPPMQLEYNLNRDAGGTLQIGNVLLTEKNFFFSLLPMGKASSELRQILSEEEAKQYALVMRWPEPLLSTGYVEMISKTGAVLWKLEITKEMRAAWKNKMAAWQATLKLKGLRAISTGLFSTQYAHESLSAKSIPLWNQKDTFRFCLTNSEGRAQTRLCSRWYGTKTKGNKVVMGKARVQVFAPRVLIQGEKAPLSGDKPVNADTPTSFFAELLGGESYEFVATSGKLNLMDISDTVKPNILRIVGYDNRPTTPSVAMNPKQYGALTKLIGFEATIGDNRKFWIANLKRDKPLIYLQGVGGGVFKQTFDLSDIPRSVTRPYLHKNTPNQTYNNNFKLFGRKLASAQLSTDQNSVVIQSSDQTEFLWYFKAEVRGKINKSYLDVSYEGKSYRSYFEAYKGYPRELSLRFTGFIAGGQSSILGEVAYNQWFETLLGYTGYYLGRHRWGVSFRAFQAFNQLKVDSSGTTAKFAVMNVDLKYRLTPGLWGRDETLGLTLSYQDLAFGAVKAPMLGTGAFWARSMPRAFDDFLNVLPFLKYPKWVDMELIYYASSMNEKVKLDANFSLNFHGKVLWSDNIFGEAGFGMKRFAFTDQSQGQKASLNSFFGTVGLGLSF